MQVGNSGVLLLYVSVSNDQLPPSSGSGAISKKEQLYWRSQQNCVNRPRRRDLHSGIGGQRLDAALVEPYKEKTGPPSSLKTGPPSYFVVTPDEELLFHKKRVDAENVTVEAVSSREPDKVTTDVGKADGNNFDHQGQKRPDPSVCEGPPILLQADDTKRSSKNNRSCVSVQADVDDRNERNAARAWRTSQRAEDDHDEQMNVDDERLYTLPGWQASRRFEDNPCVNFDNDEAGPDILPGLHKFRQANDDHVENMGVGYKEEKRRAIDDLRESGDSDGDAVFEMKSSQNIARDADEDSTTCQPSTCCIATRNSNRPEKSVDAATVIPVTTLGPNYRMIGERLPCSHAP
ncbi:hypothetical protein HPB47_022289 [Ixodes persulcatus]|uniref:Uncharacterized protein n=1 Tax=Ixodes persulcatus TaxID=34615 RepID=A0AC60QAI9_IXOPE|nr:hypothetical protein HPB47_022289 [Ixodes persulcatus]